jgi:hypothetical protein
MNRTAFPSDRQPARRRPANPHDADHARAAELFQAMLTAVYLGQFERANHLLHRLLDGGYSVEQLADVGPRLVPSGPSPGTTRRPT